MRKYSSKLLNRDRIRDVLHPKSGELSAVPSLIAADSLKEEGGLSLTHQFAVPNRSPKGNIAFLHEVRDAVLAAKKKFGGKLNATLRQANLNFFVSHPHGFTGGASGDVPDNVRLLRIGTSFQFLGRSARTSGVRSEGRRNQVLRSVARYHQDVVDYVSEKVLRKRGVRLQ